MIGVGLGRRPTHPLRRDEEKGSRRSQVACTRMRNSSAVPHSITASATATMSSGLAILSSIGRSCSAVPGPNLRLTIR